MGHDPVDRSQPRGNCLVRAHQNLLHLNGAEAPAILEGTYQFRHLVRRRKDSSEEATVFERIRNLAQVCPWAPNVKEEGIDPCLIKSVGNVSQPEIDALGQPKGVEVTLGQLQDVLA